MGRSGIIVTGLVAIALVVGGAVIINNKSKNDNTSTLNTNSAQPAAASDTSNTTTQPAATAAVITYNGSLFSPSQATVKAGDTITVKNDSSATVDFESNPHPVHTDNTELNIGGIDAGSSKSFTVNKTGSWGYHNHLNSSQTGTIVVR